MNSELPTHLEDTGDLLKGSLRHHPTEIAPRVPETLLQDLGSPTASSTEDSKSIVTSIHQFIARPAFGWAAAALVLLAIFSPSLINSTSTGTFRGDVSTQDTLESPKIILIGVPDSTSDFLRNSGDFEKGSFTVQSDAASKDRGSKIIVDFNTSTISAIAADGTELFTKPLPSDDASISNAIAEALGKL